MGSAKFRLDMQDLVSVGKSALLVAAASGLTYLAQNLSEIDFGSFGVLLVPIVGTTLDTLIKWMKNNAAE